NCLGSLNVAARHPFTAVQSLSNFMLDIGRELGMAIELTRLEATRILEDIATAPYLLEPNITRQANEQILAAFLAAAETRVGMLLLQASDDSFLKLAAEQGMGNAIRRLLARGLPASSCPAQAKGTCIFETERSAQTSPCCQAVAKSTFQASCIPLLLGNSRTAPVGVALLGSVRKHTLSPWKLGLLEEAIRRAAWMLHANHLTFAVESIKPVQLSPEATVPRFLAARCFGTFCLTINGMPVPPEAFLRRRSLTLLKVLLVRYPKPAHREELLEILWPDTDPRKSRLLFNTAIHYLRETLEGRSGSRTDRSFIHRDGELYAFEVHSNHSLDIWDFSEAVDRATRSVALGLTAEALVHYDRAIALYGGDLLEEERFSDWCALEREVLRERFLATLQATAAIQMNIGNHTAAIVCYRRALQIDAALEDIHRALMTALWQSGRRAEALKQYEDCRSILQHELGVSPVPATDMLRDQIAKA
ncbi:MAG: winged helix-turn-helix domain-containing protein, partial [Cyanobacteria bacterium NC_groundwater_1444_Ag_S-0.65um_54_12]|nr:winged helix-turn-helix domain-containing protein [Cyanobacteria bacterium NC_groundwater_1444_Ag_S-0.65um_54_12]